MTEGSLLSGAIGPECKWEVKLASGKLMLSLDYVGVEAGLSLAAYANEKAGLEKMKALAVKFGVPESIASMIVGLGEKALGL